MTYCIEFYYNDHWSEINGIKHQAAIALGESTYVSRKYPPTQGTINIVLSTGWFYDMANRTDRIFFKNKEDLDKVLFMHALTSTVLQNANT